jgi:hypothetical protein
MTKIPESHHYLLASVYDVILTRITPKGYPHSTVVWSSFDGAHILLNTGARGKKHAQNVYAY